MAVGQYNRTEWFLILWLAAGALYALYALVFLPDDQTVSATMLRWSKQKPIIAGLIFAVVAHWFWSQ